MVAAQGVVAEPGMSGDAALAHGCCEAVEQIIAVLRSWAGLGVVLHREHRLVGGAHAFDDAVEQRLMRFFHVRGQAGAVYREAMILRGDLILSQFRDAWAMPSIGLALTSTDPINNRSSRGRELLINPSLRLSRTLGKSWRTNLKGDYQQNQSKDKESFAYKKTTYSIELEYLF